MGERDNWRLVNSIQAEGTAVMKGLRQECPGLVNGMTGAMWCELSERGGQRW